MASAFAKLREAHKAEMKQLAENIKMVKDDRVTGDVIVKKSVMPNSSSQTKMDINSEKLEKTIKRAREAVDSLKKNKKVVVVLTKIPTLNDNPIPSATPVEVVRICQARNINGTPCKCKATKLGKFCAKHAP